MAPATERQDPGAPTSEAVDFIRFCYRRRRVGWPELYDEMCAVAAKGLFRGWTHEELAGHGVTFGLGGLPALAALVRSTIESEAPLRPVVRGRAAIAIVAETAELECVPAELDQVPSTPSPDASTAWSESAASAGPVGVPVG